MTGQAQAIEKQVEEKKREIDKLESTICWRCDGEGDVIAEERINSQTIDVPYKTCPICGGSGVTE